MMDRYRYELGRQRVRRGWSASEQARRFLGVKDRLGILVGSNDVLNVVRSFNHWEHGILPDACSQEILAELLGITIPDLFGSRAARLTSWGRSLGNSGGSLELPHFERAEDDPMERRRFTIWLSRLSAGTVLLPKAISDLLPFSDDPELLPRITMADVDKLDATNRLFATWEHAVGGGAVSRQAVLGQLSWAADQLKAGVPGSVECLDAWRITTARLAGTAACMSHDVGREPQARALWAMGYQISSTVERDPVAQALSANLLMCASRQAAHLGCPNTGLELIRLAQAHADHASPTGRSAVHAVKARLHALLGDHKLVERELGRAVEEFGDRTEEDIVLEPWQWSQYKPGQLHFSLGAAQLFLARTADRLDTNTATKIADEFRTSVERWGDDEERTQTSARLRAATALMLGKEPDEAVRVAREAVPALPSLRSKRISDDVNDLRQATGQYIRRAEVKELFADLGVAA